MRIYYHTDRAKQLRPGHIIESEPYRDESLIAIFAPFMDKEFLAHLRKLALSGLSLHGARYVMQLKELVHFPSFSTELYYEYVRWKKYSDKPSRLQSLFGWLKVDDAIEMAKANGKGSVYEVRCDKAAFVGDMNALKLSYNEMQQRLFAETYWEGRPASSDADYTPKWECLMNLPVEVVREVLIRPSDGKMAED